MACFNGRDILNEESSYYYSSEQPQSHLFRQAFLRRQRRIEMRYPTDAAGTASNPSKQTFTAADSDKKVFTFEKKNG